MSPANYIETGQQPAGVISVSWSCWRQPRLDTFSAAVLPLVINTVGPRDH